jgi:hypothetical protein
MRGVDANGLESLEAALLQFFDALFHNDFSTMDIESGLLAQLATAIARAGAVTVGEALYLSPASAERFSRR